MSGKRVEVTCGHPEKPNFGRGKCRKCYMEEYRKGLDRFSENRTPKAKTRRDRWAKNNPEKNKQSMRASSTFYRFGITQEEYDAKLASQRNLCALCGTEFYGTSTYSKGYPVLDHSHKRGMIRDFVHRICNTALGQLRDDPEVCLLAAEYLKRHEEKAMFQSKDGHKFGSAYVAKRRDAEKDKAESVMGAAHEEKESPEFEAGEKEGMQEKPKFDAASVREQHGPALSTHVHSDHAANEHHVIGHHKDGHVHHSKHTSAQDAHAAAAELAAAGDQPSASSSGEEMPEQDGFQMPKLA